MTKLNAGEYVEKLGHLHYIGLLMRMENGTATVENICSVPKYTKHATVTQPSGCTAGHYPPKMKFMFTQKPVQKCS